MAEETKMKAILKDLKKVLDRREQLEQQGEKNAVCYCGFSRVCLEKSLFFYLYSLLHFDKFM